MLHFKFRWTFSTLKPTYYKRFFFFFKSPIFDDEQEDRIYMMLVANELFYLILRELTKWFRYNHIIGRAS